MNENWNEILHNEPIDLSPRPGFEAELRSGLSDEWNGRPFITSTGSANQGRTTRRGWLLGAAAAAVLLIGGVSVLTRTGSDPTVRTPAGDPDPSPTAMPTDTSPARAVDSAVNDAEPVTSTSVVSTSEPTTVWEPVPIELPSAIRADEVPQLVLSEDQGYPQPRRIEFDEQSEPVGFLQVFNTPDGSGWLHIETSTRREVDTSSWIEAEPVGPWTVSTSEFNEPEDTVVRLTSGELTLSLWTNRLNVEQLRDVAAGLRQGPTSSAGWQVSDIPGDLEPVVEGPIGGSAVYSINYPDPSAAPFGLAAALEVSVDVPSMLSTYFFDQADVDFEIVNVNGQRAIFIASDGVTPPTVIWEPQPRVVARLGIPDADPNTLVTTAEAIQDADPDSWQAMETEPPVDGCPNFWC